MRHPKIKALAETQKASAIFRLFVILSLTMRFSVSERCCAVLFAKFGMKVGFVFVAHRAYNVAYLHIGFCE